ncbi:MAG: hypothetical protein P8127_14670, partial [Acidobacteriota bacterium]
LTYELLESLRSGCAAGIHQAWRRAGVFPLAFPDIPIDTDESVRVLEMLDEEIGSGREFADPSLIGSFFLGRFLAIAEEETSETGRVDNPQVLGRLRESLEPATTSMHLSNQTLHLLHQGLFAMTKMRRPPERGRQVLKLARQDYFQVAWDLYGFAVALGYISPEAHQGWQRALHKVRSKDRKEDGREKARARPRPRGRRPRRRRRT